MDQEFPFGGLIGYGGSHFDNIFRFSKVFRLHAILHDAAGAVYLPLRYTCRYELAGSC